MKKDKLGIDAIIYGVYVALIPFNMILNFTGSTINKQVGLVTGAIILLVCAFRKIYKVESSLLVPVLPIILWAASSCLWSVDSVKSNAAIITLLSMFSLYFAGILRKFNSKEEILILLCMIISCVIVPLFLVGNNAISVSRGTLVSSAGTADQNSLAANMVFAAILAFAYLLNSEKLIAKVCSGLAIFMIATGIITTGSRGATLTLVISLVYYILKSLPELKKSRFFWIGVIAVVIGVFALFNYIQNNMSSVLLNRFSVNAVRADKGTDRLILWRDFLEIFADDPLRSLIGYGYGASSTIHAQMFGSARVPHNVYIQMLVEMGLIGFTAFIYMIRRIWKQLCISDSYLAKSLFIAVLLDFLTLGFFDNKGAWNIFLMVLIISLNSEYQTQVETDI